VQQVVAQSAQSFVDFPPMQKGGSFNMEAIKEMILHKANATGK